MSSWKFLARFPNLEMPGMPGPLDALDDLDYPACTTGRAAEVLGVRQAFLRSLETAGAVRPQRIHPYGVQEMRASKLAAKRASPSELRVIEAAVQTFRHGHTSGDNVEFDQSDDAFHRGDYPVPRIGGRMIAAWALWSMRLVALHPPGCTGS